MKKLDLIMRIAFILLIVSCYASTASFAQKKERPWTIRGYIKGMQTISVVNLPPLIDNDMIIDNLIHNRLNFKWYINDHFTTAIELRNRVFYGDAIYPNSTFANDIDNVNNDVYDLSSIWLDGKNMTGHSMIDRAYVDYVKGDFEARIGRQRINWGINTVWNPHDLFNTFSFLDFDYEERPGSDAIRLQYYTGFASSVELAVKAFKNKEEIVAAALWKTNKWQYDFQFLGGVYHEDIAGGIAWAGNIKNVGFKGESTLFIPFKSKEEKEVLVATISADYAVKDWFLLASALYNSAGTTETANTTALVNFNISPKNLYPYRYTFFAQANKQITPLITAGTGFIYSPSKDKALFLNPNIGISLADDWNLDAFGQIFFSEFLEEYRSILQAVYVRLKWSY